MLVSSRVGCHAGKSAINKRASDVRVGDLVWTANSNNTAATPAIVKGLPLIACQRQTPSY